jgi:hypothetical protein
LFFYRDKILQIYDAIWKFIFKIDFNFLFNFVLGVARGIILLLDAITFWNSVFDASNADEKKEATFVGLQVVIFRTHSD